MAKYRIELGEYEINKFEKLLQFSFFLLPRATSENQLAN